MSKYYDLFDRKEAENRKISKSNTDAVRSTKEMMLMHQQGFSNIGKIPKQTEFALQSFIYITNLGSSEK